MLVTQPMKHYLLVLMLEVLFQQSHKMQMIQEQMELTLGTNGLTQLQQVLIVQTQHKTMNI